MPNLPAVDKAQPPPRLYSPFAGFLSYLVPGLGQICQGRVSKGLLFFFCLYGLFFYGMALGQWSNVYLPETAKDNNPWNLPDALANIYNRPQYAGQFWIGIAAWPAIWQYNNLPAPPVETYPFWNNFQRTPPELPELALPDWRGKALNELHLEGGKKWDLAWIYTVIAGVLNILVIYDAVAGPAFGCGSGLAGPKREK